MIKLKMTKEVVLENTNPDGGLQDICLAEIESAETLIKTCNDILVLLNECLCQEYLKDCGKLATKPPYNASVFYLQGLIKEAIALQLSVTHPDLLSIDIKEIETSTNGVINHDISNRYPITLEIARDRALKSIERAKRRKNDYYIE